MPRKRASAGGCPVYDHSTSDRFSLAVSTISAPSPSGFSMKRIRSRTARCGSVRRCFSTPTPRRSNFNVLVDCHVRASTSGNVHPPRRRLAMSSLSRRTFLKSSAVAAAGVALPARAWGNVLGANSDIRVAVIGMHGRGKDHIRSLSRIEGVRIVALCDVDTAVLDAVKPTVNGGNVKTYTDLRKLFDDKEVDAVTIATPNHWHSLAAIWAMQAGKDVYVEKPVSHEIWEGRQLVNATKKYGRVVQVGTQIRSGEGLQEAVHYVQSGKLGKITA